MPESENIIGDVTPDDSNGAELPLRLPPDLYPPVIECWKMRFIWSFYVIWGILAASLIYQLSVGLLPACLPVIYAGGGIFFGTLLLGLIWRHEADAHETHLEIPSEVHSLIVQAYTVKSWHRKSLVGCKRLNEMISDLRRIARELEQKGPDYWTEFNVLPLRQKLVDFLDADDLKAQAQSILASLEDYSEDSSYRYDREYYGKWKQRIDEAANKIKEKSTKFGNREIDSSSTDPLRAELRTVQGHVADYRANWAEGSALIRALNLAGAVAVPVFLLMGLVPILASGEGNALGELRIINWAFLGIVGSITAVLLALRKSDLVEVGNTEGKKEIWKAVLGASLGLVAGSLTYGIIVGGLIAGLAVPVIPNKELSDVGLTVVWGIAAGFSFEKIFDRMKTSADISS